MSPRSLGLWFLLALSACSGLRVRQERDALEDKGHPLPLKRVRLYASGVGYFERRGTLTGERDTLPVPASHLDDALKSLVLLSPSGRLDSISFASRLSPAVARARAGLPAEEGEALSYDRLLVSLRGERVEVNARGMSVRGRVVEVVAVGATHPTYVHEKAQAKSEEEPEVLHVLLLAESGQLLRFDSHELVFIRPLDPAVRDKQSEFEAESELLQEDVSSLREHLKSVTKSEAGGAQDQVMKRILERDEQLRKLKAERRALDAELTRKEQALSALFAAPQKTR